MHLSDGTDKLCKQLIAAIQADERSQGQISKLTGVPQPTLSRLLTDPNVSLRPVNLDRLCELYGLDASVTVKKAKRPKA